VTYASFDDVEIKVVDEVLLVLTGSAIPFGKKISGVLETDSHTVRVSGLGPPPVNENGT
jgi:hypothetical protein